MPGSFDVSDQGDGLARLSAELGRLDPHSFWILPAEARSAGDLIVGGATGFFLVASWPAPGPLTVSLGRPAVGGNRIPGLSALRSDAKDLAERLSRTAKVEAEPVVCLTAGVVGMPKTIKGIRFVQIDHLVRDLTSRNRILAPERVQHLVRTIGVQIAGDQNRRLA